MTETTPAGWYPDQNDAALQRYWDGSAWTTHTAPSGPAVDATPTTVPVSPPAPAPSTTYPAPPAPLAASAPTSPKKKWLIGGAIVAGVIVVGSIGAAIGGSKDEEPVAVVSPSAVSSPSEEAVAEPTAEPTATPEPAVVEAEVIAADPVAFRAQANSHLDDMNKDLDDIVVTVQESGFFRLLSNYAELSFNLGQLEALDVPASASGTWPSSLVQLEASLDALSDAISTEDGPTILSAVDAARAQVAATRAVADAAQ